MEKSNDTPASIEQMQAVTISREYGSGGGEIAARLARVLGWKLFDHEAVVQVAQELGVSVDEAAVHDEQAASLGMQLLKGLSFLQPPMGDAMQISAAAYDLAYHETMHRVIEAALAAGHVVIVGRGSQMLLKERRDILHVRIVAPLEYRIAYVMQREGLSLQHAQSRIHYKDSGRARYLQRHYHQNPTDPLLYDLVINTAILSLDNAVQLIRTALEMKAGRLNLPPSALGPGAGLPLYPEHTEDFGVLSDGTLPEAK
ncbi:MAG TPA: cytidylate kinase-like family protein [Ktedonobacteraceae bacterium]|nr:cytidylate kinase-like family protein [Ktedonobacteraceae bacterium]